MKGTPDWSAADWTLPPIVSEKISAPASLEAQETYVNGPVVTVWVVIKLVLWLWPMAPLRAENVLGPWECAGSLTRVHGASPVVTQSAGGNGPLSNLCTAPPG